VQVVNPTLKTCFAAGRIKQINLYLDILLCRLGLLRLTSQILRSQAVIPKSKIKAVILKFMVEVRCGKLENLYKTNIYYKD